MVSVRELLVDEMKDLYDAEKQLVKALPKMVKAASNPELSEAFENHLEQTRGHVQRLEQVFETIGAKPRGKTCEAMKGLVEEGQQAIDEGEKGQLRDNMLIGAAKRVEHYEMAAYQTLILLAESIDNESGVELLRQTLSEEEETDEKLGNLCEELLQAISSSEAGEDSGEKPIPAQAASHTRTRKAG